MTRKLRLLLASLFVIGWLFLFPSKSAHADEVTVQVTPATPSSDTATATTPITVETVADKVEAAAETLQAAAETQATAITTTIKLMFLIQQQSKQLQLLPHKSQLLLQ